MRGATRARASARVLALGASVACGLALLQSGPGAAAAGGVSVKPPLPVKDYAGLACDITDRKLRKVALPNGVGPEARVAAACMQLSWKDRGKVKTPTITVYSSPGFPAKLAKRIKRGIKAGHRLFGQYADVRSYEALASVDPAFSCSTGKDKVDPRTGFDPTWLQSWRSTWNSGCPGADYSPGGWTSTILGEGGREYFGWTLIKPEQSQMLTDTNVLGPTWFMGAVSHEFAHSIQSQRSVETRNGSEFMGRWYGEGQAQYLGNTAAAYTIGPATIRDAQLEQLREVMREEGVKRIDLATMENDWQTNLVYPAGYFAYEWLVAHYGVEATFDWWNAWNSDCPEPGKGICWRQQAEGLYGMSADELIEILNDYVNAQVKG